MRQSKTLSRHGQTCLQELMRIWFQFERDLNRVPVIKRLESGHFTTDDYRKLLLNLRQQVIEGSRWITRVASSFDRNYADVRSIVIGHAKDEHRDYEILEQDYLSIGGNLNDIQAASRNAGTEALHAFLMYRAGHPNPVDMIGAMWIIEGLGQKMAGGWSDRIIELVGVEPSQVSFMRYHGENDDAHMNKLYQLLDRVCQTERNVDDIVRTAIVTGRLYIIQLEEIDHE